MVSNQQFRLKWNNHRNTVFQEFETLLHNNSFVDCTIGADGKYLKAHKIVLSACSPYLQNVFSEHFDKHPVILLKDVSFKELKCMIDYMYCGEVNISECELPSFLRTAQSLKIKGLAEDINEYDSASDNEHQEVSNLTENCRTVEPNVEIHDDEGPPCKKSAPSLIYSNFAGRKRKPPNNAVPSVGKNSNNEKLPALTSKLTGGNVPSCADTDNSDSKVCTTSKENNHREDINDKKNITQDDHQELVKNKAEVKEEPVDGDDDNSSYEFGNNTCEDFDPLNEDSESNCANSGKNFTQVSIANVSYSEGEANDDDDRMEIKEEELTEVFTFPEEVEAHKIRVRSTTELMPLASNSDTSTLYVVDENEDDNEMIVNVNSIDNSSLEGTCSQNNDNEQIIEVNTLPEDDSNERLHNTMRSLRVRPNRKIKIVSRQRPKRLKGKNVPEIEVRQLRKILPASMKPTVLLPTQIASSPGASTYAVAQKRISAAPSTPTSSASTTTPIKIIPNADVSQILSGNEEALPRATTSRSSTAVDPMSVNSQFILINPSTTRVVLLNSDSAPIRTISRLPTTVNVTSSDSMRKVAYIRSGKSNVMVKSPITPSVSLTKFRKIAPLVKGAEGTRTSVHCKGCLQLFADAEELKKHSSQCPVNAKGANILRRGRRRNDA